MNKLIGSIFIGWALLRNVGVAPPELPQCIPPSPLEEALLPDGTEPVLPNTNSAMQPAEFTKKQEAAAAEVREKFPSYPESVLQREIISSVQATPRPTYYQPIQAFPFYNCTTSS